MVDYIKLDKIRESKKYFPISDCINDITFSEKNFALFMAYEHPTLQQTFMRASIAFIKEMAEKTSFDDRNKDSVELARRLVEYLDDIYLPFV